MRIYCIVFLLFFFSFRLAAQWDISFSPNYSLFDGYHGLAYQTELSYAFKKYFQIGVGNNNFSATENIKEFAHLSYYPTLSANGFYFSASVLPINSAKHKLEFGIAYSLMRFIKNSPMFIHYNNDSVVPSHVETKTIKSFDNGLLLKISYTYIFNKNFMLGASVQIREVGKELNPIMYSAGIVMGYRINKINNN